MSSSSSLIVRKYTAKQCPLFAGRSLFTFTTLLLSLCMMTTPRAAVANAQFPPGDLMDPWKEPDTVEFVSSLPSVTDTPSSSPFTQTWHSFPSQTTTSTVTATPTMDYIQPYYPGSGDYQPLSPEDENSNKLLNLYFLLIALGIIFICLTVYFYRRRKISKGARAVQRGQVALRRDLEAGGWRVGGLGRWNGSPGLAGGNAQTEEGLDERGEAPPPYAPRIPPGGRIYTITESSDEGYSLPRLPERAALARIGPAARANSSTAVLPAYEDVANIPHNVATSSNAITTTAAAQDSEGGSSGNRATTRTTEVVSTPPAVGTGLPAVHVVSSPLPSLSQ